MSSVQELAEKILKLEGEVSDSIGYLIGCSKVLLIWLLEHTRVIVPQFPKNRRRIHRWSNVKFMSVFNSKIKDNMVLDRFEDVTGYDIMP